MTHCDAGPLIALIDKSDKNYSACVAALPTLSGPLLTTWSCLTEAMYLLGQYGDEEFDRINIVRDAFHPESNYTIHPGPKPTGVNEAIILW